MTVRYKTEGFVFKKEDNLDANRIFSIFTKDFGRVEVLGRGIRKINSKLKGGIGLFSLSDIEFVQGKIRKTLTDAVFLEKFKHIFEEKHIFEIADKISNVADSFIKGEEPDQKIWDVMVDSFEKINQPNTKNYYHDLVYYYFFWNFVSALGYSPEILNCAVCQKKLNPYELYFSSKEGGVICRSCYSLQREGIKIKSDVIKILRLILKKEWDILSKIKIENNLQNSLIAISDHYYLHLSSILKSDFKND